MPTTKGTRAIPATVLPTPPALPMVTTTAARTPSAPIFSAIDPAVIAWNTPLVVDTSAAGTNASTATVATMYVPAISTPDAYTARGSVFCGSRTSWLIAETSSSPLNANAICDQKFTVSQFQTGNMLDHVKCVTDPCFIHRIAATPSSASKGKYVDTPPAFCSHLPTFSPMIFSPTATTSMPTETESKNVRFCESAAPFSPIMYALLAALASSNPGK